MKILLKIKLNFFIFKNLKTFFSVFEKFFCYLKYFEF